MIVTPAEYRTLIGSVNTFVRIRRRQQLERAQGKKSHGDPVRPKVESLIRKYHAGTAPSAVMSEARRSFSGWTHPRLVSRAQTGITAVRTYMNMDQAAGSGAVIELFRKSAVSIGGHEVRVRRDVLLFGHDGHRLRILLWAQDPPDRAVLPLLLAPVVLASDNDLGLFRLSTLEFWDLLRTSVDDIDIDAVRRLQRQVTKRLKDAEDALRSGA